MIDIRDAARAAHLQVFSTPAEGVWSAPGRVNLIGEHTEYNDGYVLPFAINRRTVVTVSARTDSIMRVASSHADEIAQIDLAALQPGELTGWSAYPLGVAWALTEFGAELTSRAGLDLFIESDVPVGSGLSSSAAVECAVASALNDLWELELPRETLARVCQRAETLAVGTPTGIMDHSASLLGHADSAVFLDCRTQRAENITLGLSAAGLAVLVIATGAGPTHATGAHEERRTSCEEGAAALGVESLRDLTVADLPRAESTLDPVTFRRVRHVITENQRVLDTVRTLREHGPAAIGDLVTASHRSIRDDFEILVPELDLAVETALASGALGARMTGGGAAIALIPAEAVSLVQVALDGAFSEHGYSVPDTFVVTPAAGATKEP